MTLEKKGQPNYSQIEAAKTWSSEIQEDDDEELQIEDDDGSLVENGEQQDQTSMTMSDFD